MERRSPAEVLRETFTADLKKLNQLIDNGSYSEAKGLARQLAPKAHLAVSGDRGSELYDRLMIVAGRHRLISMYGSDAFSPTRSLSVASLPAAATDEEVSGAA